MVFWFKYVCSPYKITDLLSLVPVKKIIHLVSTFYIKVFLLKAPCFCQMWRLKQIKIHRDLYQKIDIL